ncbi:MAG TPA: chloride channel protein [Vicinamibacterales bacterium]|nr:chloride channel protein [Vicinamibacterales bacterium]
MTSPLPRALQLRLREHQVFLVLSIVIGVLAGLSAVLFTVAIDQTSHRLFGLAPSRLRLFLIPALVSIPTGVLLATIFPGVRGSGLPQTKAAYRLSGGFIRARVPFGKFLTGVLSIGAGHSMGPEGPSVQIGAGLASVIGRWLGLSPARTRDLVPIAAAAALASAFNTPVAAVLFALEEIIGDLNAPLLGSAVIASVASVIVERSILGNEPLFHVPTYHLVHPAELGAYAVLGVVGGVLSLAFCKGLLNARLLFRRLPRWTAALQPAIGGVVIGAALLIAPQVMGVGYDYVDQALNGGLLLKTMALLCLMKLGATIVSCSSGAAGGIFAPSLYIGAMAGGTVGLIVHRFAPFPTGDPGAYALVGMGTAFAGIVRAPMTSVFMIFEITQDYQILVPLMVANLLSFLISKRYQPLSINDALLQQDDVHLPPAAAVQPGPASLMARALMRSDVNLLDPEVTIAVAAEQCAKDRSTACLVGTGRQLIGTVSAESLASAVAAGRGAEPLGVLVDTDAGRLVHVHPDHPVEIVFDRFGQSAGLLPVVSRTDARRVDGVIALDDLVAFGRPRRPRPDGGAPTQAAPAPDSRVNL